MCFVDMEKAFDRVPIKVMEWAMKKKGLSEAIVWAVMSLYDSVKVGVNQGSVLSPLLFAIVVDDITRKCKNGSG